MTRRIKLTRKQMRTLDDSLTTKFRAITKEIERQLASGVPRDYLDAEFDKRKHIADLHYIIVMARKSYEFEQGLIDSVPSIRRLDETYTIS